MHCVFCGFEVPDHSRFCLNCGKEVNLPDSADTIFVTPETSNEAPERRPDGDEDRGEESLFTKGQQRLLIIVGIVAALALVSVGITWGIVSAKKQLAQKRADELREEMLITKATTIQTRITTVSETVSQSQSTTVATETTLSAQEINAAILDDYYAGTLVPLYGEANLSPVSLICEWYGGASDLQEFMPEDRKGIIKSIREDLNGDGAEELMVVISRTFDPPVVYTESGNDHINEVHYDGIEIKVFQVVSGTVQEMISDNKAMIFNDRFMFPSNSVMQICILENGGEKYIYVLMHDSYINESGTDIFRHEFFDVTANGIHCASGTRTRDGIIYDELDLSAGDSWGTTIFSIWGTDLLENYYNAIKARLEPFGLDCSFMDSYYNEIQSGSTIYDYTYSDGLNQSKTPLSDLIGNIRVIALIDGTNDDNDVQTYSFS